MYKPLSKGTLSDCLLPANTVLPQAAVEGSLAHPTAASSFGKGYLTALPQAHYVSKVRWNGDFRPAKAHSPRPRSRDALSLPLADVGALVLGHERQHLQHDIAQKGAH